MLRAKTEFERKWEKELLITTCFTYLILFLGILVMSTSYLDKKALIKSLTDKTMYEDVYTVVGLNIPDKHGDIICTRLLNDTIFNENTFYHEMSHSYVNYNKAHFCFGAKI